MALIFGSIISGEGSLGAVGFILLLVTSPFSILLLVAAFRTRLSVDERGLNARGTVGMSSVGVAWDEIQALRLEPGSEGAILKAPLEGKGSKMMKLFAGAAFRGVSLYSPEVQQLITEGRFLPLEAFTWWFQKGDLRSAIEKYCPRVLTGSDTA